MVARVSYLIERPLLEGLFRVPTRSLHFRSPSYILRLLEDAYKSS